MSSLVSHLCHEPTSDMASASIFNVFMFMLDSLHLDKPEVVNSTIQETAAILLLSPYSNKNISSETAHRIVGIRAVVKSEHGIIAPFAEQRPALTADIIRRSDPA